MRLKIILMAMILLSIACTKAPQQEFTQKKEIAVGISEEKQKIDNVFSNFDVGRFIGSISNIPSPTSSLKYVTQTNNIFEVKYGDGIYHILSKNTTPVRLS